MGTAQSLRDCRKAFAAELVELAVQDERIVVVCNDSVGSSNLGEFRERYPDRLINVGIAEQDLVGAGAGLANAGYVPFVCGAAPFLTGRGLEQIKTDVVYSQNAVILCGMSPGFGYGELGPTHHSIEDLSWLRALPELDIVVPADFAQMRQAVRLAAQDPRPTFIRVGRTPVPDIMPPESTLVRGRVDVVREGTDVALVATGPEVARALDAARLLEANGVSTMVINAAYIAPFDHDAIASAASHVKAIVTAEDAIVTGGLGAAVAAVVAAQPRASRVPVLMAGAGEFAPIGDQNYLFDYYGLDPESLAARCQEALSRV